MHKILTSLRKVGRRMKTKPTKQNKPLEYHLTIPSEKGQSFPQEDSGSSFETQRHRTAPWYLEILYLTRPLLAYYCSPYPSTPHIFQCSRIQDTPSLCAPKVLVTAPLPKGRHLVLFSFIPVVNSDDILLGI